MIFRKLGGRIVNYLRPKIHIFLKLVQSLSIFFIRRQHSKLIALTVRNLGLFRLPLKVETAANYQLLLLVRKVSRKFRFFLRKMLLAICFSNPEIFINMKQRKLSPLTRQFMSIVIPQLAVALLGRNVVQSMRLLLAHLFFYHLPTTTSLMGLSCGMPATTSKTVMLHTNRIFRLFERKAHLFTPEYISIEIFTKNLGCLVIDFILRINHNHIFRSSFVEDLPYNLRMTRINEH